MYSHRGRTIVPPKLDVPEVAEVLNFLVDGHPGPTSGCLRIDPASGPNSRWNLRACEVFAQDFSAAQYPDADGKTLMDASHEFYRLIPTLSSRHAVASGFTDVQSYVKFQESFAKHIRRHQVCRPNTNRLGFMSSLFSVNRIEAQGSEWCGVPEKIPPDHPTSC